MSIYEAFLRCESAFEELYDATWSYEGSYHYGVVEDHRDFKSWAHTVGAAFSQAFLDRSLDNKLRESSPLRDSVPHLLALLEQSIENACQVLRKEVAFLEAPCYKSYDLGLKLKLAEPETKEILSCADVPDYWDGETVAHLSDTSEDYASDSTAHSDPPEATELQNAVDVIRQGMDSLWNLELDNPESLDRFESSFDEEVALFEDSDIALVRATFPDERLGEDVRRRMGKMITMCRQILFDRQREKGLPLQISSSTINPDFMSCASDPDLPVRVPNSPVELKEGEATEFECKYCYNVVQIDGHRAWEEHVINDLQPYVCTYTQCNGITHFFEDMDEWAAHEKKEHDKGGYWCNLTGHETFEDRAEFTQHMVEDHHMSAEEVSPRQYFWHASVAVGVPPSDEPDAPEELCNLCFQYTHDRTQHVARHLQQLAMFAIPWEDFGTDEVDTAGDEIDT
ncbi:uncharacterized protein BO80DRAFT_488460 [Aspergillus ibericus CBS 121593]|uniref:Oxidoreductase acuF-like C2H2 type zinc-finger domain-containing protein n=1 Tax=Aspergillus ibericus CBS 121593 TaxID=1448316 RepID=A0A395H8J5_9EURO|nr:hypothetical protein BO80DRAFT_488460 [Aspergillus ibericus CBS 121593]RAL03475.1 hypothetical protein BO80DRAFT_488460 [Aspergillus ibericus CBS 121593]